MDKEIGDMITVKSFSLRISTIMKLQKYAEEKSSSASKAVDEILGRFLDG